MFRPYHRQEGKKTVCPKKSYRGRSCMRRTKNERARKVRRTTQQRKPQPLEGGHQNEDISTEASSVALRGTHLGCNRVRSGSRRRCLLTAAVLPRRARHAVPRQGSAAQAEEEPRPPQAASSRRGIVLLCKRRLERRFKNGKAYPEEFG